MEIKFVNYSLKFDKNLVVQGSSALFRSGLNLLVGRNGSGKTSVLKSLPNLNNFWNGKILIDGIELNDYNIKSKFGFQFELDFLPNNLYPKETLLLCGQLQSIENSILKLRLEELIDLFEIDTTKEIQFLSYGNKKKLLLAMSLLNSPVGLIWDEPFEGLDYMITSKILEFIRHNKKDIIVIATNNLNLLEEINGFVTLISKEKNLMNIDNFDLNHVKQLI
jgi:ABC-2 type transport system ATP-binding protein